MHVVLTRSPARSLPLASRAIIDVFLFYLSSSVAGRMCMCVICQKSLARLFDYVCALEHEAEWREAAQSEPNTTQHITTKQATIFHSTQFNEEVDDL